MVVKECHLLFLVHVENVGMKETKGRRGTVRTNTRRVGLRIVQDHVRTDLVQSSVVTGVAGKSGEEMLTDPRYIWD